MVSVRRTNLRRDSPAGNHGFCTARAFLWATYAFSVLAGDAPVWLPHCGDATHWADSMYLLPHTMQTILDEQPSAPNPSLAAEATARLEQRFGMTASMSLSARMLAEALSVALSDPLTRGMLAPLGESAR
jgi:hypothetical protein